MSEPRMLFLITGQSGFVGSQFSKCIEELGFECQPVNHSKNYTRYELPKNTEVKDYDRVFLIHAGQPKAPRTYRERSVYLETSNSLFLQAKDLGIRLVFVSSLSSFEGNPSNYSCDKNLLEQAALNQGHSVVKLGFVCSTEYPGYVKTIRVAQGIFKHLGLGFLLEPSAFYATDSSHFVGFINTLIHENSHEKMYVLKSDLLFPVREREGVLRAIRKMILSILAILSKLRFGIADALLSLIAGMGYDREGAKE